MRTAQESPRGRTGGQGQAGEQNRFHRTPEPRHFSGPVSTPVENVIERLDGVRRSPCGWTAKCPAHEDRYASLSVAEGRDGRALVNCFAGCTAGDIVHALGLELRELFPPREDVPFVRRRPARSQPVRIPRTVAETLTASGEFCALFEAAKLLAPLPPALMKQDVVSAWERLARIGIGIPELLRLASLLRGLALFRYGDARHVEDTDIARAVRRLVDEIERAAA